MELYREERPDTESPLVVRVMPDISQAVESIFQMPDFALWAVGPNNDLSIPEAIRTRQIGGNTSMVYSFRPYMSHPEKWGGFIVERERVLYCPQALPLHVNRYSYTMIHGVGKNFYTTMTFPQLLRILLENGRTLYHAEFDFASTFVLVKDQMNPAPFGV